MFSKSFLKKMKQMLLEQKNKLVNLDPLKVDIDMSGDETDEIQANILLNMQKQLMIRNLDKIEKINDALLKIENNTYGLCQDCNLEIAEKRLLANPHFLTCVGCAEDREAEEKQRKRV